MKSTSKSSRSENESRWFVYRARFDMPWYCWLANEAQASVNTPHSDDVAVVAALRDSGYEVVEVVPLSRLEAAEGDRDRYQDDAAYAHAEWRKETCRLDLVREALEDLHDKVAPYVGVATWVEGEQEDFEAVEDDVVEAMKRARAALSTGDRQQQHLGVRTGVPTQPEIAGQDSEGGTT